MTGRVFVNAVTKSYFWMVCSFLIIPALNAHASTVNYTLDSVILDDTTQMTGEFSWTFTSGDFENGVGQWISLDIPWTLHNQYDLNTTYDIGSSIEITFPGNVHDDGVDITLFLLQPLTPSTFSTIDLIRSKYDIGGNGFHAGIFLGGSIVPSSVFVGDFDVDGDVDGLDFLKWQRDETPNMFADYANWNVNFGTVTGPAVAASATAVPEPNAILLFVMASISRVGWVLCGGKRAFRQSDCP